MQPSAATAIKGVTLPTPASADPNVGLTVGTPPPGMPGAAGNSDYGNQSNPASVQFYHLGTGNADVANNTGTVPSSTGSAGGPGVNLVNLGNTNVQSGNNTVNGAGNFGINTANLGDGNTGAGVNFVNNLGSPTSTGLFGGNLAFVGNGNMGNGNINAGVNEVEGSNSVGVNVASVGSGNAFSGVNFVEGVLGPAFGVNFASVGNNNPGTVGINEVINTGGAGTFTAGVNDVSVGDNALASGENLVEGADTFGANFAVVMSTAATPITDSGNNTVKQDGVFGTNFAFVGADSSGSGNNTSTATGGGFNLAVIAPGQTSAEGNNTAVASTSPSCPVRPARPGTAARPCASTCSV